MSTIFSQIAHAIVPSGCVATTYSCSRIYVTMSEKSMTTMVAKSAAISSVVLKDFLYGRPSSSLAGSDERNLK